MSSILLLALLASTPSAPDALRLGVDYRWWGHNLRWTDGSSTAVGPLPTGLSVDAQWFPAAYFVANHWADVGATIHIDATPSYSTELGETSFRNNLLRLRTGAIFRLRAPHLEPAVQVGLHHYEAVTALLGADGSPRPNRPNLTLDGPRLALGLRLLEVWRITFDVAAGVSAIVGVGELGNTRFFPKAQGSAYDGALGIAFRTWPFLDVRVGADVTLFLLNVGSGQTVTEAFYGVSLGLVFKGPGVN